MAEPEPSWECSICMERMLPVLHSSLQVVALKPCGHLFHKKW
jgi:hypothetical protein